LTDNGDDTPTPLYGGMGVIVESGLYLINYGLENGKDEQNIKIYIRYSHKCYSKVFKTWSSFAF